MCVNMKAVEGDINVRGIRIVFKYLKYISKLGEIHKEDEEVKSNLKNCENVNKWYEKIRIYRAEPSWESSHLK